MKRYVAAINKRLKNFALRTSEAYYVLRNNRNSRMDQYTDKAPHPQNIIDLFKDEWASQFPAPFEYLKAGDKDLFNDQRIQWFLDQVGDIKDKKVLELGPLEGAHAYMMHQQGASVVSIEANPRAYLRCLAVKQVLNLHRVDFLYGDFMKYLKTDFSTNFDLCVASGVLYHMCDPVELISLLAQRFSQVFIWTHYYSPSVCLNDPKLKPRFTNQLTKEYEGFKHTLYRFNYKSKGGWKSFCGGPAPYSNWLSREDVLGAFKYFGFNNIQINDEQINHVHGPSFSLLASRTSQR